MVIGQSDRPVIAAESPQGQDAQTSTPLAKALPQRETSSDNVSSVLLMLGTSPERRQLAAELENLLRQGKFEAAEDRLYTAIEIGSLAVLLTDRLKDPRFLAGLQALGGQAEQRPSLPPTASPETLAPPSDNPGHDYPQLHVTELAELKKAKEREEQRADATARELATINEELQALRVLREREASSVTDTMRQLAELKAVFERERERADAASRELAAAREEHRTLQTMREQDSTLLASNRRELSAVKAELEKERQQNELAVAAISRKEQPLGTGTGALNQPESIAGLPSTEAPSSTASVTIQEKGSAPANSGRLRGVPNVLTTSTLLLQGRLIRLFGVEAAGDVQSKDELTHYLGGREVVCEVVSRPDIHRCQVDGKDLSVVVLFNGGGRVTSDGTAELKIATDRARSARIGIWNRSVSSK